MWQVLAPAILAYLGHDAHGARRLGPSTSPPQRALLATLHTSLLRAAEAMRLAALSDRRPLTTAEESATGGIVRAVKLLELCGSPRRADDELSFAPSLAHGVPPLPAARPRHASVAAAAPLAAIKAILAELRSSPSAATAALVDVARACVRDAPPPPAFLALTLRLLRALLPDAPPSAAQTAAAAALVVELLTTDAPRANAVEAGAAEAGAAEATAGGAEVAGSVDVAQGGVETRLDPQLSSQLALERLRLCHALLARGGDSLRQQISARLAQHRWLGVLCARGLLWRMQIGTLASRSPLAAEGAPQAAAEDDDDDDQLVLLVAWLRPPGGLPHPRAPAADGHTVDGEARRAVARARAAALPLAVDLCEALGASQLGLRATIGWQLSGGVLGHSPLPPASALHFDAPLDAPRGSGDTPAATTAVVGLSKALGRAVAARVAAAMPPRTTVWCCAIFMLLGGVVLPL